MLEARRLHLLITGDPYRYSISKPSPALRIGIHSGGVHMSGQGTRSMAWDAESAAAVATALARARFRTRSRTATDKVRNLPRFLDNTKRAGVAAGSAGLPSCSSCPLVGLGRPKECPIEKECPGMLPDCQFKKVLRSPAAGRICSGGTCNTTSAPCAGATVCCSNRVILDAPETGCWEHAGRRPL